MSDDVVRIKRAVLAVPKQRFRWILSRNGEDLFGSTEGYRDRDHCVQMAKKAIRGEYAGARFVDEAKLR